MAQDSALLAKRTAATTTRPDRGRDGLPPRHRRPPPPPINRRRLTRPPDTDVERGSRRGDGNSRPTRAPPGSDREGSSVRDQRLSVPGDGSSARLMAPWWMPL